MLEIINDLQPFFEDCYRRINVREYAKLKNISPPTASSLLQDYQKHGLLKKERFKNYQFYFANTESKPFIDISRTYWNEQLEEFCIMLEHALTNPTIVLFGSLAKAEAKKDSDIDIAVFAKKKEISNEKYEKKLKRKIQIFWFSSLQDIKNKELANGILNGYILKGRLSLH